MQSNIRTTRRWFTEGWTDPSMAEEVFDPRFATNGLVVGAECPLSMVVRRLTGFPDITTVIEDTLIAARGEVDGAKVEIGRHMG